MVLPHSGPSKRGQQGSQPPNVTSANIINPTTTLNPNNATNQTTLATTTITTSGPNQSTNSSFNYSNYIQQLLTPNNASTTTIFYEYCVGSPTPGFNQSYYSQMDEIGAESWKQTTGYPIPFLDGSCASTGGTVYCVGDSSLIFKNRTRQAYYAPLSPFGVGGWNQTSSYPVPFTSGSCTAYNGHIYCVGTSNRSDSEDVFYAAVGPSGIGTWKQTTSYPIPFYSAQCNAYNGYIYCIGDSYTNVTAEVNYLKSISATVTANEITNGSLPPLSTSSDYYAPISSSGVGTWRPITQIPIPIQGGTCAISNSTIYCIGSSATSLTFGGFNVNYTMSRSMNSSELLQSFQNQSSPAFYAPITASGSVGNWIPTSPYPEQLIGTVCTSNKNNIFCVGGRGNASQTVLYSDLGPTGIVGWNQASDYPIPFYSGYCSTNAKV